MKRLIVVAVVIACLSPCIAEAGPLRAIGRGVKAVGRAVGKVAATPVRHRRKKAAKGRWYVGKRLSADRLGKALRSK